LTREEKINLLYRRISNNLLDTSPLRRGDKPLYPINKGVCSDCPPRRLGWKVEQRNFTVEKPGKHLLTR
jgi:hypothetical protein